MATLLDTNILLRMMQPQFPLALAAEEAIGALHHKGESLHIAAQNIYEFWTVVTRPARENGLGMSVGRASHEIRRLKQLFNVLPERPLLAEWERLVSVHGVSGKNSHDTRLVAAMTVNNIENILTFNIQDFSRYSEIRILDPRTLI